MHQEMDACPGAELVELSQPRSEVIQEGGSGISGALGGTDRRNDVILFWWEQFL